MSMRVGTMYQPPTVLSLPRQMGEAATTLLRVGTSEQSLTRPSLAHRMGEAATMPTRAGTLEQASTRPSLTSHIRETGSGIGKIIDVDTSLDCGGKEVLSICCRPRQYCIVCSLDNCS